MLPSIGQHAKAYGIKPLKRLGQHFIFDLSLCQKIVKHSQVCGESRVLEIGPGTAGLTRSLLEHGVAELYSIEIDNRFLPILEDVRREYNGPLHILNADALHFDLSQIATPDSKIDIVSNLPYNLATSLIIKWLNQLHLVNSITVMVQREIADKLTASAGTHEYSRSSVITQLYCVAEKAFNVSKKVFYPAPQVESSVIKLTPRTTHPPLEMIPTIEMLTRNAFGQRRKMLRSSLKPCLQNVEESLAALNLCSSRRAEELRPSDYYRIALSLQE